MINSSRTNVVLLKGNKMRRVDCGQLSNIDLVETRVPHYLRSQCDGLPIVLRLIRMARNIVSLVEQMCNGVWVCLVGTTD